MAINTELVGKILQSIRNYPEEHDQGGWINMKGDELSLKDFESGCGTSACIAGWAVMHMGYSVKRSMEDVDYHRDPVSVLSLHKEGQDPVPYGHVSSLAIEGISGGMGHESLTIQQLFYTFEEELAVAKLMFLHLEGRMPVETWVGDDKDPEDDGEYFLEGISQDGFSEKYYKEFLGEFENQAVPA